MKLNPALFIDRDGTLMEEINHCADPNQVRVYPGALEALRKSKSLGWLNIIVTNQSGIARGYFTIDQFLDVQRELMRQLANTIDASYMAPDHPDNPSPRRKPGHRMLLEAAIDHDIDLCRSWMIGDKASDIECGQSAGVRTILLKTGYGKTTQSCSPDFHAKSIMEAVNIVLGIETLHCESL